MGADRVWIAGVGMTPFVSPSRALDYVALVGGAVREALADANLEHTAVKQAYAGYVYGDSTSGQRALYAVGLGGVPIVNVNNNCATGSSSLFLARQAILSGTADCVLAVGFEQMPRGALSEHFQDRPQPLAEFLRLAGARYDRADTPLAPYLFGCAARDYCLRYGLGARALARIASKSRRHAARNPRAMFRDPLTEEQILASPMIFDPLTRLQCCPPTSGAAAAILVSANLARRLGGRSSGVCIAAQSMVTDEHDSFSGDMIAAVGAHMSSRAAREVYEASAIGPEEITLAEVHDCFTINEILSCEALGLAGRGESERMILDGENTYGGKCVVNPSGGLLAKGHPLGATGLAQCHELVTQLRQRAGARQVHGARFGLQHNIGLGGACVVTLYEASRPADAI